VLRRDRVLDIFDEIVRLPRPRRIVAAADVLAAMEREDQTLIEGASRGCREAIDVAPTNEAAADQGVTFGLPNRANPWISECEPDSWLSAGRTR